MTAMTSPFSGFRARRCGSLLALISLAFLSAAQASPHTPGKGSSERTAILNSLRIPIQRELEQPIVFNINGLKVENGWAFVNAEPRKPNGHRLTSWGKDQKEANYPDSWGGSIQALLRKRTGGWRVVTYVVGASDVAWSDWDRRFGAPTTILH